MNYAIGTREKSHLIISSQFCCLLSLPNFGMSLYQARRYLLMFLQCHSALLLPLKDWSWLQKQMMECVYLKSCSQIRSQSVVSYIFQQFLAAAQKLIWSLYLEIKYPRMQLYGGKRNRQVWRGPLRSLNLVPATASNHITGSPPKAIHKSSESLVHYAEPLVLCAA